MYYGICLQNYIPMRAEPSERSEMVSQVLYGELFLIIETNKAARFTKIRLLYDDYEGWIDEKTAIILENDTYQRIIELTEHPLNELYSKIYINDGSERTLGAGCSLWVKKKSIIYPEDVLSVDNGINSEQIEIREKIQKYSIRWIDIPYLWGGRSVFGADCSGFVQNIYKQVGIKLPRNSGEQSQKGNIVNFLSEARPGDLAFFDNEEGEITHTGIIMEDGKIIHSSGMIKIDLIDHQGIFSEYTARYTHKLRLIKNVIND